MATSPRQGKRLGMVAEPPCEPLAELFTTHWRDKTKRLRELCNRCERLDACTEDAMANDVAGFAAGMTPRERQIARRTARAAAERQRWAAS